MSEFVLSELGAYNLLQCRPCLVADLLCVAANSTVRVYSVLSGQLVTILHGHSAHVTSLCSNPNGSYQLISASLDGTVRIWSVDDGMLLNTIKITDKNSFDVACAVPLYGVKATKKGIHLLSRNDYGRCSFPEQAEAETSLEVVQKDVINFNLPSFDGIQTGDKHWSLNGKATRVVFLHTDHLKVLHIKSRKMRQIRLSAKLGEPISCCFSPKEESIMVTFKSGQIRVFSNFTKEEDQVTDYREHWHTNNQISMDAQFSSDGNGIVSGGQECVLVHTLWKGGEDSRRTFVPRLDAPIIWVHVAHEYTFVSMASNCIQIILQGQVHQQLGSLARSITGQYPAGINYDSTSDTLISNGRPGTIQFYSLKNDRVSSTVDVTGENVIIGDGTMSNASNVVKVDMLDNLMITLDRLADSNKSRDTVRIWRREEQGWKQELMIDRAHVGRVTDLRIFDENTFFTSGEDARIRKWSKDEETWRIAAVANYRNDQILNFDISADKQLVTTCDAERCTVFSSEQLELRTVVPPLEPGKKLEQVYHGRHEASSLLLVKHGAGFYVWNVETSTYVKRVDNISNFTIWRSTEADLFSIACERQIKVFSLEANVPMLTIAKPENTLSSCIMAKRKEPEENEHAILEKFNIYLQSTKGELFQVLSVKMANTLKESARPEIRLNRKNILTPVGGLLVKRGVVEEKNDSMETADSERKVDNKKLYDLLHLPAYMMPNAASYAKELISALLPQAAAKQEIEDKEKEEEMEVDSDEENEIKKIEKAKESVVLCQSEIDGLESIVLF